MSDEQKVSSAELLKLFSEAGVLNSNLSVPEIVKLTEGILAKKMVTPSSVICDSDHYCFVVK